MSEYTKIQHYINGVEASTEEVYRHLFRYLKDHNHWHTFTQKINFRIECGELLAPSMFSLEKPLSDNPKIFTTRTSFMCALHFIMHRMRGETMIKEWLKSYNNNFIQLKMEKFYVCLDRLNDGDDQLKINFVNEIKKNRHKNGEFETVHDVLKRTIILWPNRSDFFNLTLCWADTDQHDGYWYEKHGALERISPSFAYLEASEMFKLIS